MSPTVTCTCGARLRVPQDGTGRTFRCPKCERTVEIAEAAVPAARAATSTEVGGICPICQSAVRAGESVMSCPACDQVHHEECWEEVGGCATYGCTQGPRTAEDHQAPEQPLSAWGDTKQCPACGETIKAIALKCRYCQTDFDTVDPLTVSDLRRQAKRAEATSSLRKQLVALFAFSFVGCVAPVTLIVGLSFVLPKRRQIAAAGPIYMVMAFSSILLSALYSALIALFVLAEVASS